MSDFPKRIVYVDDDQTMRGLVRECLERSGEDIVLVTCSNGEELMSRIRELQPDLILLDMVMPDMDGPATLEALKSDRDSANIPVIFLTGKSKLVMVEDYRSLGALGVIHKPFEPKLFPELIKEMWTNRFGVVEE